MNSSLRKKYHYDEYFINSNHFKKLYGMYLEKNLYNKFLDKIVFVSMMIILMSVVLPFFVDLNLKILLLLNSISSLVILIFLLELVRSYAESKSSRDFFKKNWIDFILIVFLSFYFLFISILGFFNIKLIESLKLYFSDSKNVRILYKVFRR